MISVLGMTPGDPEKFFRAVGYCTQFDSFAKGITGREFIEFGLKLHGYSTSRPPRTEPAAVLESVSMTDAADRKVAAYSKGMRQRIRLAHAIAHDPQVLVLDEPLNGLDPDGPRGNDGSVSEAWCAGLSRHHLEPHSARSRPDLRSGDPAELRIRRCGRSDSRRSGRSQRSPDADPGSVRSAWRSCSSLVRSRNHCRSKGRSAGRYSRTRAS